MGAESLVWVLVAFICGAFPFSVWLGEIALKKDIRQTGDGNPGALNVWKSGGPVWGFMAILLDFFKGAIPVGIANYRLQMEGWLLVAVAIAPVLGHAFSPFLKFKGGKALAVTFGIWSGLSLWLVPLILGGFFAIWRYLLPVDGWAVMAGLISLLLVFIVMGADPLRLWVWLGVAFILAWTHRADLKKFFVNRFSRGDKRDVQ